MNLKEIELRLKEIKEELRNENADVEALKKETDELIEKRNNLLENEETRKALLDNIANQNFGVTVRSFEEDEETRKVYETEEYRSAFLKIY